MQAGDARCLDALDQSCVPEVHLAHGGGQREMSQLLVLHFLSSIPRFHRAEVFSSSSRDVATHWLKWRLSVRGQNSASLKWPVLFKCPGFTSDPGASGP